MNRRSVVILANTDATAEALQLLSSGGIDVTLATLQPAPEGTELIPPTRKLTGVGLSDREIEVLQLMSEGNTNKEIGTQLHLARATINSHSKRLFRKLGVNDRAHAVLVGLRTGLLDSGAQ